MTAYYNEFDPYAAAWLRNLISAGHIAPGDVDERSIADVRPDDLRGYTQCHFFAGIGVWSLALRRAGWADDRPVWTGSCPCQPFSAAGKGGGFDDERHLWPHFHYLIGERRPAVVFGEQVASKDGLGWLDLVQADLEGTGYASGAVGLCAAGVGAPHIRQRLWWVGKRLADTDQQQRDRSGNIGPTRRREFADDRAIGRLGHDDDARLEGQRGGYQAESGRNGALRPVAETSEFGGMADADGRQFDGFAEFRGSVGDRQDAGRAESGGSVAARRDDVGLADADGRNTGAERQQRGGEQRQQPEDGGTGGMADDDRHGCQAGREIRPVRAEHDAEHGHTTRLERPGPTNGHWRDADWLFCRDGKWRPVEPGTFPLAHGAASRVGRLRAYGNAIVADAAQAFIESCLDIDTIDA